MDPGAASRAPRAPLVQTEKAAVDLHVGREVIPLRQTIEVRASTQAEPSALFLPGAGLLPRYLVEPVGDGFLVGRNNRGVDGSLAVVEGERVTLLAEDVVTAPARLVRAHGSPLVLEGIPGEGWTVLPFDQKGRGRLTRIGRSSGGVWFIAGHTWLGGFPELHGFDGTGDVVIGVGPPLFWSEDSRAGLSDLRRYARVTADGVVVPFVPDPPSSEGPVTP
jgi:hypothetical protein